MPVRRQDEGEIAADAVIAVGLQLLHVPAHPACEIEHGTVDVPALLPEKRHLPPRLVLIAMRIKLEVRLAEPLLVPGHLFELYPERGRSGGGSEGSVEQLAMHVRCRPRAPIR